MGDDSTSTTAIHYVTTERRAGAGHLKNKKDANSVIGVFQEVLIKLYYIPILLYIEGQDDIY